MNPFLLFSGTSNEELAQEIAKGLKSPLGKVHIERFPDKEIGVHILENVRGKEAFVLQSAAHHPNSYLMELLILVDALKRASSRAINAVMPYFPYGRQDRKEKGRVPITAKLVADLLEKAGVSRVVTLDLHTDQIQGFFNIPVEHLSARPLFAEALRGTKDMVIVSPDVGRNRLARDLAQDLGCGIAVVEKRRKKAEKVEAFSLIGDVKEKTAVLLDDICSTGTTLRAAAQICRKKGARKVVAAVTHCLLKEEIRDVDQQIVTNSIAQSKGKEKQVISIGPLLAKAIQGIASNQSISRLF